MGPPLLMNFSEKPMPKKTAQDNKTHTHHPTHQLSLYQRVRRRMMKVMKIQTT